MNRGLSLLELLVVLALMTILAGSAVLSHQAMRPGLDLRVAARQVVLDLRVARLRAIADNVNHRVVFPTGGEGYQPQRKNGGVYVDDGAVVRLPRGILISDCNATENGISFKPRGNAATFGTVIIRNGTGGERRIIVDIAGQVRVQMKGTGRRRLECAPEAEAWSLRSEAWACCKPQVTPARRHHGFTLVEVLVAVLLLSTMALTLTQTLIASQRARAASERWTQAVQLAAEGIEQLRAGQPLGPIRIPGDFDRRAEVAAWNGHDSLVQLVVTVSWNDGAAHDFQLTTLARR